MLFRILSLNLNALSNKKNPAMYNDLVDRKLTFGLNIIGMGRNKKELKIDISKVMIY